MCIGKIERKHLDHAAARKIVIEDHGIDVAGTLQDRSIEMVKDGIEAERERIIAVAKDYALDAQPDSEYRLACDDLIEAIRKGA